MIKKKEQVQDITWLLDDGDLSEIIDRLKKVQSELDTKKYKRFTLERESRSYYSDCETSFIIYGFRNETRQEKKERLEYDKAIRERQEQADKLKYEMLKKKFENV